MDSIFNGSGNCHLCGRDVHHGHPQPSQGHYLSIDYTGMAHPKPKRKKRNGSAKKKPGSFTNKLDALVRKVVRARDIRCVTCGSQEGLECSHYLGRAKMGVRWDLDNVNLQCHKCHRDHHAGNPAYMRYMESQYGNDIFEKLYTRQQKWIEGGGASASKKEQILEELTAVWENLK